MICTTFKSSPLRIFIAFLLVLCLGYLTLSLAAGSNPYRIIQTAQGTDFRIKGVQSSGWTTPDFTFTEDKIYSFGAIVLFNFETARPKEAGPALFSFEAGEIKHDDVTITKDPIIAPSPKDKFTPIQIRGVAKNSFRVDGNEKPLGAKLLSTELRGRYHLLFPVLGPILPLLLTFTIATVTLCLVFSGIRSISLIPAIITLTTLYFLHHDMLFELWPRDAWLWGAVGCLAIGGIIVRTYSLSATRQLVRSGRFEMTLLALIFIFGLWLRISAVQFGLPQLYHPDESRKIKIAQHIIQTGNLDPNYFRHPSFMVYSTALLGKIKSLGTGSVPDVSELAVLGRSVSAVFGAASIIILYLIGSILFGPSAGLLAAMLLAVSPLHVVCSRYIKEDVCMTFFSLSSLYCVLLYCYTAPKARYLLLGGLLAGFASSVKYTGVLSASYLAAPLLLIGINSLLKITPFNQSVLAKEIDGLAVHCASLKDHTVLLLGALILMTIGFLLITPYSILNNSKFVADFLTEKEHMDRGHAGTVTAAAHYWTYHFKYSIIPAMTSPISLIALAALGIVFGLQQVSSYVLLLGVLLFYLPAEFVNAKPFPQPERYILPCIPFLALAVGGALTILQTRYSSFQKTAVWATVSMLLFVLPCWYSTMHRQAALHDTRQLATDWVLEHIPSGSTIVTDWYFYSPSFSSGNYTVKELKNPQNAKLLKELSLSRVQNAGAQYFISSSFFYQRWLAQVKRGNKTALGFNEIFTKLKPVVIFSKKQFSYGFHNPTIRIYKVPPKNE